MGRSRTWTATWLALAVTACDGQIGELSVPLGNGSEPTAPTEIGPELASLEAQTRCAPLRPSERPLGVSPEGALWLTSVPNSADGSTPVRVVDPVTAAVRAFDLPLAPIGAAVVHGPDRASVIAAGGLWVVGESTRIEVTGPFGPSPDARLCGRLDADAFVLDGTDLFQREGDAWIRWDGLEAALGAGNAQLLRRDGACWASGDGIVLRGQDRGLWLLTPAALQAYTPRDGDVQLIEDSPATVDDRQLRIDGRSYDFGFGAPPDAFATAGAYAWLRFGASVVRFDGEGFLELETQAPTDAVLQPFAAGGLWIVGGGQACVFDPGWVRMSGLAPQERREEGRYALTLESEAPESALQLTVEGQLVPPARAMGSELVFEGALALGWSNFAVSAAPRGANPATQRRFQIKRLPGTSQGWEADIRPLYAAHCADAACHVAESPAGAPDLSTYEAWVNRAEAITRRVLEVGDMPPLASRGQTWTDERAEAIRQWLNGGLRP